MTFLENEKEHGSHTSDERAPRSQTPLKVASVTLSLLAVLSSFQMTKQIGSSLPRPDGQIDIEQLEKHFLKAREALKDTAVAGYMKDNPDPAFDSREGAEYFAAQYALTPVALSPGSAQPVILGNFHDPASVMTMSGPSVTVNDLGDGLFLFKKNRSVKT